MSKVAQQFKRYGDKKNSDFFEEYLEKIYTRREQTGLDELIGRMRGIMVQVSAREAIPYFLELYLMTPYRLRQSYGTATHTVYILTIKPEFPALFVLEPIEIGYADMFTTIDLLYARAKEKPNARYLGEIYQSRDKNEVKKILESNDIRFQKAGTIKNNFLANENFIFTERSYFTNNLTGYTENDLTDFDSLNLGGTVSLSPKNEGKLKKAHEVYEHFGFHQLIRGIDHMATRVFCGEREHALLEFLTMTPYYFWGAYTIEDMNSSTNVTRYPNLDDELLSPAKVFTANNTPFYVNSFESRPSPTEDFVRNFGRRMHHLAYEVADGAQPDGTKSIDYVVGQLAKSDIPFLAQIIGECTDFPDLKQIFSKSSKYSFLITEYVQRCHDFQGFFTKTNVAFLTEAAGKDEALTQPRTLD